MIQRNYIAQTQKNISLKLNKKCTRKPSSSSYLYNQDEYIFGQNSGIRNNVGLNRVFVATTLSSQKVKFPFKWMWVGQFAQEIKIQIQAYP